MFCTNCGKDLPAHIKYCPECGSPNLKDVVQSTPLSGELSDVDERPVVSNIGEVNQSHTHSQSENLESELNVTGKDFAQQEHEGSSSFATKIVRWGKEALSLLVAVVFMVLAFRSCVGVSPERQVYSYISDIIVENYDPLNPEFPRYDSSFVTDTNTTKQVEKAVFDIYNVTAYYSFENVFGLRTTNRYSINVGISEKMGNIYYYEIIDIW